MQLAGQMGEGVRNLHCTFRKRSCWAVLLLLTALSWSTPARAGKGSVDQVNVLVGTGSGPIGFGGTMPFVTPPFGMTDWTPQTRQNRISVTSYQYADTTISGFMGTHQPAIWMGDYGYVTLMPEVDRVKTTPEERKLTFSHADELARPDYYSVSMKAGEGRRIRTEMTATEHCAYMRFTFPKNASSSVMVEASRPGVAGFAQVDATAREITGYNPDRMDAHLGPLSLPHFKGYFVVQFRKAFRDAGVYGMQSPKPQTAIGAYVTFRSTAGEVVEARIGTSFVSIEQARANLKAEIPAWDFERVRKALRQTWDAKLSRIAIQGGTADQRKIVFTGVYHALLYPRLASEYGRYYSAFDDTVHRGQSYTAYSTWDTFRAENSLLTLLAPERIGGMVQALLQDYQEGGWMPKWPNPSYTNIMIGTHADSLVAEAIQKHFHGFDYQLAWNAVYKDAMTPPEGDTTRRWADREPYTPYEARAGLTYLKQLGYIPTDKTAEAASSTLEDAYDDWCVAQVAKSLGMTKEYDFFLQRSLNYKHLFNPATGFMQGKRSDGSWADPSDGWTEGDTWVYTWAVMHDIPGLIQIMGGRNAYNAKLDAHFAGNHNVHSNEPSHHYGYLYDYSGQPWKTQERVREIAAAEYANLPSGIDGDDDCGQMSAWYIFTAFGFYPVNPASGDYMIGSPLFSEMSLRLENGKTFRVVAENNSATNVYIQSATLNGIALTRPVLRYDDIVAGANLKVVMGPHPSTWAAAWTPASISGTQQRERRETSR
jgi:predicted alpha-1,2-mannosidase